MLTCGFFDSNLDYTFFECGFRLEGAHQYNFTYNSGLVNFLDVFIIHALTGNLECLEKNANGDSDLKLAIINIYASEGIVGAINGVEEISRMEDCCLAMVKANIGDVCKVSNAILTKIAMFEFNSDSAERLCCDVKKAYDLFECKNVNNQDMIYDRIDPAIISSWWEE